MNVLNKSDFNKILPLAKGETHNKAIIHAIIEGNLDGQIFADDPQNPAAAYISWEFSFLLGKERDISFSESLCDMIFSHIIANSKEPELILFMDKDSWPHLVTLLEERGCITIKRKMFSFRPGKFAEFKIGMPVLPNDFSVSAKDIRPNGFEYSVTDGTRTISTCKSVAVGAGETEIDIFTDENYRNRGFAAKAAAAFIDHCIKNGITPVWSCWPEKINSISLAKKLGFDEAEDVPVVFWAQDMN